jgi:hypothetical protein
MTTVRRDPDTDLPVTENAAAADGVQGEGDYEAARRHRESAENFVQSGRVAPAAEEAAPADGAEARELEEAEREGRSHARE